MFRNRKSAQKPANELYVAFKQTFPHVGPNTTGTKLLAVTSAETSTSLASTSTQRAMDHRQFGDSEGNNEYDSGLGESDHWKFTPSMLDTNSFAFTSFANQHAEDFTPTLGAGISGVFHNQAGDLHTPGMGFGLGTPLSTSAPETHMNVTPVIDMHGFHQHLLRSEPLQSSNPFAHQESYAPSSFQHQDSGYETLSGTSHNLPVDSVTAIGEQSTYAGFSTRSFDQMPSQSRHLLDKFRYHVTLNAPTAMIRHANEIPVTYLNKGQAYAVSISDSMGLGPAPGPIKYRTVIRISFEDEQQRQRPSACWQLWKEGRGLAEAHQRAGKLQAVEFVDPNPGADEETKWPHIELEKASFDSFSVTWSPVPGLAKAECSVAVRFNFLSTDFSHSKGVKGIPVRLCAKTEIISSGTPDSPPGPTSEVCFCKVKLFRDHGAERKLSNDIAHIKKTIEKLKQQIAHVESGAKEVSKRKRSGGERGSSNRPGKVQKHKRSWSISSQGSSGRAGVEEDLHMKLGTMQDMFTSTRPTSVLYLKGYDQDDPDAFPVFLPGEPVDLMKISHLERTGSWDRKATTESTPTNSCAVSPSPSSHSVPSDSRPSDANTQKTAQLNADQPLPHSDWEQLTHLSGGNLMDYQTTSVKFHREFTDNSLPDWVEAFEVDPSYKAPPERPVKPIACFYVLIKVPGIAPEDNYYKAVYLMERTVEGLVTKIAMKCGQESAQIIRTLRINSKGLKIVVDDEVVRELPEGQDMIVDFADVVPTAGLKQEPGFGASTPKASGTPTRIATSMGLEMRLIF